MTSEAKSERRVLFLPGAGADPNFWKPVSDLLPASWKKVRLGWPGIGHNPAESGVENFSDLVAFAERELVRLAESGLVDLVAQSMGGAIALALVLRRPEHVRKMVLCVTAGGMDVESFGAIDWRPGYRLEYPRAAEWLYEARPDYAKDLSTIAAPTLLLWGDADPISPLPVGEEFRRRLPNASLVVVRGGTHALAVERAEEVVRHIATHLSL